MTKGRAIYLKCLDCSGDDRTEVLFCHLFDCPLWPYRCGCHISSSRYRERINRAFEKFIQIAAELQREGLTPASFLQNSEQTRNSAGKRRKKDCDKGRAAVQAGALFALPPDEPGRVS